MISHANLNSGQTAGYYQKDDYYKSQDEGVWTGRLAREKGLAGEIRQEDFNGLILRIDDDGGLSGIRVKCDGYGD